MTHFLQGGSIYRRFYNKGFQTLPAGDQMFKYVSRWGSFHIQTTAVGKERKMAESKGPMVEQEGEP